MTWKEKHEDLILEQKKVEMRIKGFELMMNGDDKISKILEEDLRVAKEELSNRVKDLADFNKTVLEKKPDFTSEYSEPDKKIND